MAPLLLSVFPFGLVCGVDAMNSGLSLGQAEFFSLAVFAGASQLVTTQLLGHGAPLAIVVLAPLGINLRFLMYSAGMAPYFGRLSLGRKVLYSFIMTDQSFALSQAALHDPGRRIRLNSYYLGCSLGLFCAFQTGHLIGALAGARIPAAWGMDFAVPLAFSALLLPALRSRSHILVGLLAGVLALCLSGLPYMLGVFSSAAIAIAVGYFFFDEKQPPPNADMSDSDGGAEPKDGLRGAEHAD